MKILHKEYFVLINYATGTRLLCSWWENEPDLFGQKVLYIGVTNGLGGYRYMVSNGWIDRRFQRVRHENKIKMRIHANRATIAASKYRALMLDGDSSYHKYISSRSYKNANLNVETNRHTKKQEIINEFA